MKKATRKVIKRRGKPVRLSRAFLETKEYLEHAFQAVMEIVDGLRKTEDVKAVVVFGSAVRPEDFVIGLSDVDVLVLTGREPRVSHGRSFFRESEVDLTIMSLDRLRRLFELGSPLAFILHGEGRILEDDRSLASLVSKPVATGYTLKVLRDSIFTAAGLALEAYFSGEYGRSVSHAYHAVRHLIRYKALLRGAEAGGFPLSDEDAKEESSGALRDVFTKLVEMRKMPVDKHDCRKILDEALSITGLELRLKHASLPFIESSIRGSIALAIVKEKGESMIVMVEAFTQNGLKRFEIGEEYVREIESLFEPDRLLDPSR